MVINTGRQGKKFERLLKMSKTATVAANHGKKGDIIWKSVRNIIGECILYIYIYMYICG